jgi:hypothetical protein
VATADRAALRDRIADTLAAADGWRWVSDSDKARSSTYRGYQTRADAVLAVLPAPADRAAILREAAADLTARTLLADDCACADLLRRMAAEAQQPTSTAPLAANLPLVKGRCPACNGASLFLGDGGYVTCSRIDCPEPDAASTALEQPADEAQQPETQAVGDCPYGEGPGDGSGCIKPAGHVVTPGVAVVPCSRAVLHQPHIPHVWWPQPGMAYVQCPGHSFDHAAVSQHETGA